MVAYIEIDYNGNTYTIDDDAIMLDDLPRIQREASPINDQLTADEMDFGFSDIDLAEQNWKDLPKGSEIRLFLDGALAVTMYAKSVSRLSVHRWHITATSAVGLLIGVEHAGGMYLDGSVDVGDLIAEIMGGNYDSTITYGVKTLYKYTTNTGDYYVEQDLADIIVVGWLPLVKDARDNLHKILQAYGASVLKYTDGYPLIGYNNPQQAVAISDDVLSLEGSINYDGNTVTDVYVVEHDFVASTKPAMEILADFSDNLTAFANRRVLFAKPIQPSTIVVADPGGTPLTPGTDYTITTHCNYCIISTAAAVAFVISGQPYQDNAQELHAATGITGQTSEIHVTQNTLINSANSANVLARLADYYANARIENYKFELINAEPKTGDMVTYNDVAGDPASGIVTRESVAISGIAAAQAEIVSNWQPGNFGNTFNAFKIVDKTALGGNLTGTYSDAELEGKDVMIVIFDSASGGSGGTNGEDGQDASHNSGVTPVQTSPYDIYLLYQSGQPGQGGGPGQYGEGGPGAKRYNMIRTTFSGSYAVSLGAGGAGGNAGLPGADGDHTTFGSWSSDVHDLDGTYVNFVSGDIYGGPGLPDTSLRGYYGAAGGYYDYLEKKYVKPVRPNFSPSITPAHTMLWTGHDIYQGDVTIEMRPCPGGNGAGAGKYPSPHSNGTAGGAGDMSLNTVHVGNKWYVTVAGGDGGDGGDQVASSVTPNLGQGGSGGGPGSGGGGAGAGATFPDANNSRPAAKGGRGGKGGKGGKGSDGFVLIYYHN